jgi:hypothetical protein
VGSWGTGIFEDDVALDVRGTFEDALASGASPGEAGAAVLEEYGDALEDMDDGPIILFALADLQLGKGHLEESIRRRALEAIEEGTHLSRWEDAGGEALAGRQRAIEDLRQRLLRQR